MYVKNSYTWICLFIDIMKNTCIYRLLIQVKSGKSAIEDTTLVRWTTLFTDTILYNFACICQSNTFITGYAFTDLEQKQRKNSIDNSVKFRVKIPFSKMFHTNDCGKI